LALLEYSRPLWGKRNLLRKMTGIIFQDFEDGGKEGLGCIRGTKAAIIFKVPRKSAEEKGPSERKSW